MRIAEETIYIYIYSSPGKSHLYPDEILILTQMPLLYFNL